MQVWWFSFKKLHFYLVTDELAPLQVCWFSFKKLHFYLVTDVLLKYLQFKIFKNLTVTNDVIKLSSSWMFMWYLEIFQTTKVRNMLKIF